MKQDEFIIYLSLDRRDLRFVTLNDFQKKIANCGFKTT